MITEATFGGFGERLSQIKRRLGHQGLYVSYIWQVRQHYNS